MSQQVLKRVLPAPPHTNNATESWGVRSNVPNFITLLLFGFEYVFDT